MVTMYAYELFIIIPISSSYIWMDFRLKGLSIESKNTRNEVRTKKLWSSEVGGHTCIVRPEKFPFLEKWQNRNFDYKIVISVKNP